ncbi:MAG: cyclophilin-like fold protein [Chloroflexi bacterium]|nr:cyclophilin-like fold protein [Chloroflexota bacterium]
MTKRIRIRCGELEAAATLNETDTAQAIWEALPIKGSANVWGDEIYFRIPVALTEDNAQEVVELGDLGYWPPGSAFCIFFGPTPMSHGDEIRPASPVNVFGRVECNLFALKNVSGDSPILIERMD